MNKTHNNKQLRYAVTTRFLTIFIPMGIMLATAAVAHYYTEMKLAQLNQSTNEENQVALAKKGVTGEMHSVIADLTFLAKLNELWDILDAKKGDDVEPAKAMAAQEFLYFSEKKGVYDQISYLDIEGNEIIRINYGDGHPYIVEQSQLNNISDRYYFQQAIAQELGGIYMSPFELEEDYVEASQSPRSVIRFATPLLDSFGDKRGILMVSFRGEKLIWGFTQAASDIVDHVNLLNYDGEWLFDPNEQLNDASFFKGGKTFGQLYPKAWQEILNKESGNIITPNGLFTFTTVYPAVSVLELYSKAGAGSVSSVIEGVYDTAPRFWKIVSVLSPKMRGTSSIEFFRKHLWLYLFLLFFLTAGSLLLAQKSVKKHLAQAHAEYERRFRKTLETIQLAAVTLNPQGRVVFCNDYLSELLGWPGSELVGKNWFDVTIPEEYRHDIRNTFAEILDGKKPPHASETTILTKTGRPRIFSWNNTLSFSPSGEMTGLTSIGQDITEQKENELQLHKLSRAVEQTQESIIITDSQGVMEYVNPGFTKLTGYSEKEALGKTWDILTSHESNDDDHKELRKAILKGEEWRGVLRNKRKTGEPYWENIVISPIRNDQREIIHFLAIREDVTEHRKLREEVEERNRQLARAESLAAMGRMATMIAHDLRNPLSSVKMTLQILNKQSKEILDEGTAELPGIALDQVKYMENILAGLLAFSQPEALHLDWISINKLLDTAISTTQKAIQDHSANVVTDFQEQLPTIHGDPTKLRQVFCNLIVNAVQATEGIDQVPQIIIRTKLDLSTSELAIRIEICDNGSGVELNSVDNLFEPFYTTRAKGTGLGLPIVKKIIEQHQGKIRLTDNENHGTCAVVLLPTRPLG